ncbi:juvenile hormone acid O-methyltransferase-like [Cydia splendana]|uniref:juvenile hormone acid O-methyltransferase-like n=1 Tax=Cydia splendana TaxID=1100963 RepID=UPI002131215D
MNNAELYTKNNALQKKDTLDCLEEFAAIIKWKKYGAKIIDIGCGDGSTTTEILKSFLPEDVDAIVGGDLSEKMVNYANEHYGGERTVFIPLDIQGRLPAELGGRFDHAFSFFTLHWIKRQKAAFSNIYRLLDEGGSCLLLFLGHMPIYDVFRVLARRDRWSAYLNNVDSFTSPYHDSQDPENEVKTLMTRIGFKNVEVRHQDKFFTFSSLDNCKKAVKAVTPFDIPEELWPEYLSDYLQVVRDMRMMDINNNQHESIKCHYKVIVAMGTK